MIFDILEYIVNSPTHTTKISKNVKKKIFKIFSKNQQKNVKMSGSKSTDKVNKKLKNNMFVQKKKSANPKVNVMCEYGTKIKLKISFP